LDNALISPTEIVDVCVMRQIQAEAVAQQRAM